MHRRLYVIILIFVILTGCTDDNNEYERIIVEKDDKLEYLYNQIDKLEIKLAKSQEDMRVVQDELADFMIAYDEDVEVMEAELDELESILEVTRLDSKYAESMTSMNFVTEYANGMIGMGHNPNYFQVYNNIRIVGYGEYDMETHEIVDISGDEVATLRIDISGDVYNFKIGLIEWDSEYTSYQILEEVYQRDVISNTDILYGSVLPEGIPFEVVQWEDINGKEFNYLIGDNGLSGTAFPLILISEHMN